MKEYKLGFIITVVISVIALRVSFVEIGWLSNFAFAVLGSALITGATCLINYLITRTTMINRISRHLYRLAYSYRMLVCCIRSQKHIVIKQFCKEISELLNCCEETYDISRGMFKISSKERFIEQYIYQLSDEVVQLEDCYKYPVSYIISDLNKDANVEKSMNYFDMQVKSRIKKVLKIIAKIENRFYGKKVLSYKKELRQKFKEEFGEL